MFVAAFCVLRLVTGPMKRTSIFTQLPAPLRSGRTDAGLDRTRDGIRAFRIPVTHNDFPRFLWENERVNEEDMKKGFLRGQVLVKVCFSHPSSLMYPLNACRQSWPYSSPHLPHVLAARVAGPGDMRIGSTCKHRRSEHSHLPQRW
jgi:hypothetical protein